MRNVARTCVFLALCQASLFEFVQLGAGIGGSGWVMKAGAKGFAIADRGEW